MASINKSPTTVKTFEGATTSRITDLEKLKRMVMSCLLWEDNFYVDGITIGDQIGKLTQSLKERAIPVMLAAKHESKLRHTPLWMAVNLARVGKLKATDLVSIITRPDDMTEFLAMYWSNGKVPLAKQIKVGLAGAFKKFNEYSLAKYNRKKEVKLRDVLRIVRPKPDSKEQEELWGKLIRDELTTPDTWEVALSGGADKKETFTRLIQEGNLGSLAFLRNLRNMKEAGVDKDLIKDYFTKVNFDKILPFQFITAARYYNTIESSIEKAMFKSMECIEKSDIRVALLVDVSGSMNDALSAKSDQRRIDVAKGLAVITKEMFSNIDIFGFNNSLQEMPDRRGFALADCFTAGGGTEMYKALNQLDRTKYDVIVVITDEQTSYGSYTVPANTKLFIVNVANYQNGIMYNNNTVHVNGWSENVIKFIIEYCKNSIDKK